jgi:hypothetical protein
MEAAFSGPLRRIGGPKLGISCIVKAIENEFGFITAEYVTRNPAMCKLSLGNN